MGPTLGMEVVFLALRGIRPRAAAGPNLRGTCAELPDLLIYERNVANRHISLAHRENPAFNILVRNPFPAFHSLHNLRRRAISNAATFQRIHRRIHGRVLQA